MRQRPGTSRRRILRSIVDSHQRVARRMESLQRVTVTISSPVSACLGGGVGVLAGRSIARCGVVDSDRTGPGRTGDGVDVAGEGGCPAAPMGGAVPFGEMPEGGALIDGAPESTPGCPAGLSLSGFSEGWAAKGGVGAAGLGCGLPLGFGCSAESEGAGSAGFAC